MHESGVYVAIGGNLPLLEVGPPAAVLAAAVRGLPAAGVRVLRCSRWYRSAAEPPSAQPEYVNGVLEVGRELAPPDLLQALHRVEAAFDRVRTRANAARTLDLDLLAHGLEIVDDAPDLILPHPRLHQRAFVLLPLCELAPGWRHPLLGRTAVELLGSLPADAAAEVLPSSEQPDWTTIAGVGLQHEGRRA